jgi:hypothetical protein
MTSISGNKTKHKVVMMIEGEWEYRRRAVRSQARKVTLRAWTSGWRLVGLDSAPSCCSVPPGKAGRDVESQRL